MIGDGIRKDVLQHLAQQKAVREFLVGRDAGRTEWRLSVRLGRPHAQLIPVRLRREVTRTWDSVTAIGQLC